MKTPHLLAPLFSLALTGLGLLGGCAGHKAAPQPPWLPDSTGWDLRSSDDGEAPAWVMYDRDAPIADVKELRIVGVVDATPERIVQAIRHRLLADEYMPDGLEREILKDTADEVVVYGLMPLPFPFDDREATERVTFTHDPDTGTYRVHAEGLDTGDAPPDGVIRIPAVRNTYVIAPSGAGQSVITNDSVHDLGGGFPNWVLYPVLCGAMISDLSIIGELAASHGEP